MQMLFQSFLLIAASEMGDKTQLLALILAVRYKQPWTIMLGILTATLLNHGLASYLGDWIGKQFSASVLNYWLVAIFFAFAIWMLIPDKMDEATEESTKKNKNAFLATVVLFFLAEMGDKTQLATLALGAKFQSPFLVTAGTTLGMLFADGLAVFFGEKLTRKVPMQYVRAFAAITFFGFGLWLLISD